MSHMDIDSSDVVRLVLQFLKENNLQTSMQQLQNESGVTLNTVDNVDNFLNDIRHGRWNQVLTQISSLKLPLDKLTILYEQVIFELLEAGERDLAKEILHCADPLVILKSGHPERYLRLETFCKRPYFNASDVYEMGSTKESRRQDIASLLAAEVSSVEPSRLLSLLGEAMKYQQSQGLLQQGVAFDLFRNARKAAKRDVEERITKRESDKLVTLHEQTPQTLLFSPNGETFSLGGKSGLVEVWDTEAAQVRHDLEYQHNNQYMSQGEQISCGVFSKDGDHIALGDQVGHIKIWKISTGQCLRTFTDAHRGSVFSLCFSRDGTQLLSASFDKTARIHGLKSGRTLKEFRGHSSYVNGALFTKDSAANVVTASSDGTMKLWDSKTTECLLTIRPGVGSVATSLAEVPIISLQYLPGSSDQFVVTTRSTLAYIMNLNGQVIKSFNSGRKSGGDFLASTVSPQGKWLYCVGDDSTVYVFDVKAGQLEDVVELEDKSEVAQIVHHPHRNMIAVVKRDGKITMLNG